MGLLERINEVERRVAEACARSGRRLKDVNIIAVTKYVSLEMSEQVVDAGYRLIGENRWQDAKEKWEAIGERAEWHFIGHLQTNKVKDVIGKFAFVHSLDRLSLAQELHRKAAGLGEPVRCFIQLNVSGEETKYGLEPDQLLAFADSIRSLSVIQVVGLMTMAPHEENPEDTRPVFRRLRELRDSLNAAGVLPYPIEHLSMGMSNDFEVAVEEGATFIRLGSILVGKE